MPKSTTPDQAAQKWLRGVQNSQQNYKDGVNAVTVSPGQKAAAQRDVWLQNVNASADLWATQMQNLDVGQWKNAAVTKGAPNLAAAAPLALPNVVAFQQQWIPFIRGVANNLPPRGSYAQNKARANAVMDAAQEARGRFRSRGHMRAR